mmetsp:Transcript_14064/g.29650  ORF Transcript_14064/g.29650 Transcript_14064/m.29650 type:complete len:478 (-) Transcript_14064:124-1557(-)
MTYPNSTVLEKISLVFVFLFPLYAIGCYALLYWKRNEMHIRNRSLRAVNIASIAGWLSYLNTLFSLYGGIPCAVFETSTILVTSLSVGPQLIRALALRGRLQYYLILHDQTSSRRRMSLDGNTESNDSNSVAENKRKAFVVKKRTKTVVKTTTIGLIVAAVVAIIIAILMSDAEILLSKEFMPCARELKYFSPVLGALEAILALSAIIITRNVDDALGIRNEIARNVTFLGGTCIIIIGLKLMGYYHVQPVMQTIQQMILLMSMAIIPCFPGINFKLFASCACDKDKRVNPATKSVVPGYARPIPLEESPVQNRLTLSKSVSNRKRLSLVSRDAGLCVLLSSPSGMEAFIQHCAREFSTENIQFWNAVNEYKSKFKDEENCLPLPPLDNDDEASGPREDFDAIKEGTELYKRFVAVTAEEQINLNAKQRNFIKSVAESKSFQKDTFDDAQKEIFTVMSKDSYPRFLSSANSNRIALA